MKKGVALLLGLVMSVTAVYATAPTLIKTINYTPFKFWFRWNNFPGFQFSMFHNGAVYSTLQRLFVKDNPTGTGQLVIDEGVDMQHQRPVFVVPFVMTMKAATFNVPVKGELGVYDHQEIIFDVSQTGSVVTFRVVALPLSTIGKN